jgi:hypothetical protein
MRRLQHGTNNWGSSDTRTSSDGKSGLEVLILIIEHSLSPNMSETQRILAGPLIADLVQNVLIYKAVAEI